MTPVGVNHALLGWYATVVRDFDRLIKERVGAKSDAVDRLCAESHGQKSEDVVDG
jgi:hypothetical protein